MNIRWLRLKGIVSELHGIRLALEHIADNQDAELRYRGIGRAEPPSRLPPSLDYVDEEADWARETIDHLKRREAREAEETRDDITQFHDDVQ
jgi:hypothetical protein